MSINKSITEMLSMKSRLSSSEYDYLNEVINKRGYYLMYVFASEEDYGLKVTSDSLMYVIADILRHIGKYLAWIYELSFDIKVSIMKFGEWRESHPYVIDEMRNYDINIDGFTDVVEITASYGNRYFGRRIFLPSLSRSEYERLKDIL